MSDTPCAPTAHPRPFQTVRPLPAEAMVPGRAHVRRLREVYRSAGWPCLDGLEIELLAAGLLERVGPPGGPERLRVTDAGLRVAAAGMAGHRAARSAHEALVDRVAREMVRAGRLVWTGLSLRARVPVAPSAGSQALTTAFPDADSQAGGPDAVPASAPPDPQAALTDLGGPLPFPDRAGPVMATTTAGTPVASPASPGARVAAWFAGAAPGLLDLAVPPDRVAGSAGPAGTGAAGASRWVVAMPDVFSIRLTTVEAYLQPVVHEIKVQRADLLGDLRRPEKRAAYLDLGGECWYVLGSDARGRPIATPDEIPPECGVLLALDGRLEVARPAPRRPLERLPLAVWMELARRTPLAPEDGVQPRLVDAA